MYRDVPPPGSDYDDTFASAQERLPCYAVPVPGEAAWSRGGYFATHGFEEASVAQLFEWQLPTCSCFL
jgi:hypothetical protein